MYQTSAGFRSKEVIFDFPSKKMQIMINKMANLRMNGLSKLLFVIIRVYNSMVNVFTRSSLDVLNYVIFQKVTYLVHYFKQ